MRFYARPVASSAPPLPSIAALALALGSACGALPEAPAAPEPEARGERPASCPAQVPAGEPLPGVRRAQHEAAPWIAQARRYGDPDAVLMTPAQVASHQAALAVGPEAPRPDVLRNPLAPEALRAELDERLSYLRARLAEGRYVEADGSRAAAETLALFDVPGTLPPRDGALRVALAPVPVRCGPRRRGFYTPALDLAFDRNNCTTLRAQEPVRVLADWPGPLQLVRTRFTVGWIADDAPLSPAVPDEEALFVGPWLRTSSGSSLLGVNVPSGALLPLTEDEVRVATPAGLESMPAPAGTPTGRALTRRAFLEEAFALFGAPYGWGGEGGGRDCSRFLVDVFASFGLTLPRHSGLQARAGTYAVDVAELPPTEKLLVADAALRDGIVLMQMPGHILAYLGEDEGGTPMAIHAFSEFPVVCEGSTGPDGAPLETIHRVDRVTLSDLGLGAGSARGSLLERVTTVTVFGRTAGDGLRGAAELRPAAPLPNVIALADAMPCDDRLDRALFRSPRRPNAAQPLRVIYTATDDAGPVELALYGPDGTRRAPRTTELPGPPFSQVAELEAPEPGDWRAVVGDGGRIIACERFQVVRHPPAPATRLAGAPAWIPSWAWEEDTENLYATFVAHLFRDPAFRDGGEDATWPSLQALLGDPARNLLYDHRTPGEDRQLSLRPDCADLPYFLRAYVAWKLRLPFAFRRCRRGRAGRPPACEVAETNLAPTDETDPVRAFTRFLRSVKQAVHSSTQRTLPGDPRTDVYPVPLSRASLRPGTVFADPFGHVLVIAGWLPQGLRESGVLLGADAQPDGTVGRRRFWRGSFLFDPRTDDAGAGFKAWRPAVFDRAAGAITLVPDDALRPGGPYVPYDDVQYRGSADDFYARMDALINPRALDAATAQRTLVDALEEAVARRVVSVQVGEAWMVRHGAPTVPMPEGSAIFQTTGPWEDYATPSRDLRLLISLDAVLRFPDDVARQPARYGLAEADARDAVLALRALRDRELAARSITYTRSDGSPQTLTLAEVASRAEAFESAYNPNDCVELRWGAPAASAERASCRRRAPASQRRRMEEGPERTWFRTRQRPAR